MFGGDRLHITRRVRSALTRAVREARRRRTWTIGVSHLLLGVVHDSLATDVTAQQRATMPPAAGWEGASLLEGAGIDRAALRRAIEDVLGPAAHEVR